MAVAVYGATGFTGGLLLEELGQRRERCVIGGRDRDRLTRLAEAHDHVIDARAASLDDPGAIRELLDGCGVLVNCAGPPAGEVLIRAAMDAGAAYLDSVGEQSFIRGIFDRLDRAARDAAVPVVPAFGFDYAIGDCLARLVAEGHEGALREVVIAYALSGTGVSGDAMRDAAPGREVVFRGGKWVPAPRGVQRINFRFPPPLGRQPMQRYGSGEVITVPRHTNTERVTTLITASTWSPHPSLTPLLPWLRPVASTLRRTPLWGAIQRAAAGGERLGDRDERRRSARFVVAAVAIGESGSSRSGLAEGRDFYGLTAAILAEGAVGLSRSPQRAGVLPPSSAHDPRELLDSLADRGLRWSLG